MACKFFIFRLTEEAIRHHLDPLISVRVQESGIFVSLGDLAEGPLIDEFVNFVNFP